MTTFVTDSSQESLTRALEKLEKSVAGKEKRKQELEQENDPSSFQHHVIKNKEDSSKLRLRQLAETTDSLVIALRIQEILKGIDKRASKEKSIYTDAEMCVQLVQLLLEEDDHTIWLYETIYLPLFDYCYETMIYQIKRKLLNYPKQVSTLIEECKSQKSGLCQLSYYLTKVETNHDLLLQKLEGRSPNSYTSCIWIELLRPIVKKVKFHFVEHSPDRVTSCRQDRLPEWLLNYLKEHVMEGGPLELALLLLPENSDQFLQELVLLAKWVLEERNFFRDAKIAGPRSNPLLLMNAFEEMIQFDKLVQENSKSPILGIMDLMVAPDEDLMSWWMQRERESLSDMLDDTTLTENIPKPLANHVSPRAEIFCALIQSTQYKASVLASPGFYLREVAVPLCTQFVDALHSTTNYLTNTMRAGRGLPSENIFVENLYEWMEVIRGTELAARILLNPEHSWQDGSAAAASSDHDLARFGRSLEKLHQVMVEEFSREFVETILMERAKCASYTMMAPHLLASREWDADNSEGVSVELRETKFCLQILENVCTSVEDAGLEIWDQVTKRLAQPFLEVALDVHDMTPDIWQFGAKVFCQDVKTIFCRDKEYPSAVLRLLDLVSLLEMESSQGLQMALSGLVFLSSSTEAQPYLNIHDFTSDERLLDEATSMIQAKGLKWVELEDVFSILNRRRD